MTHIKEPQLIEEDIMFRQQLFVPIKIRKIKKDTDEKIKEFTTDIYWRRQYLLTHIMPKTSE